MSCSHGVFYATKITSTLFPNQSIMDKCTKDKIITWKMWSSPFWSIYIIGWLSYVMLFRLDRLEPYCQGGVSCLRWRGSSVHHSRNSWLEGSESTTFHRRKFGKFWLSSFLFFILVRWAIHLQGGRSRLRWRGEAISEGRIWKCEVQSNVFFCDASPFAHGQAFTKEVCSPLYYSSYYTGY